MIIISSAVPEHSYVSHRSEGAEIDSVDREGQMVTFRPFWGGQDGDFKRRVPETTSLKESVDIRRFYNRWYQGGTNSTNANVAMDWLHNQLGHEICPQCAQRNSKGPHRYVGWLAKGVCWECLHPKVQD